MPCFKGLAVSIHTPEGPLPEYAIQKQNKFSRISAYIPVPPPKIPEDSITKKLEQSTFAISITLLTPGLNVPYSQPTPTVDNPHPVARVVGGLPNPTGERGRYGSVISPYVPWTTSPDETVAAYIYFDGRAKEEVATLLRRGEETWVNSRWVSVPKSEGGGLAEREFLFREVGLERWLNGLDLEGKDAGAKLERRRQKMEKKRRRRRQSKGDEVEGESSLWGSIDRSEKGVLRYAGDESSPLEDMSDDEDDLFFSDSDSDDDPIPEATGQIKVALFRVVATGEIKRGEYSPQFDAHDDDDEAIQGLENGSKSSGDIEEANVDHTTSFAKPKSLDPKTISTQTVTGIDGPDSPFAVFTFLYRGEKQLQKMGILPSPKSHDKLISSSAKRRSVVTDFATLKPLKPGGVLGFSSFRDTNDRSTSLGTAKEKSSKDDSDMDSDEDEAGKGKSVKQEDAEVQELVMSAMSPDDAKRQGELAEGVQKIRLKRQHSAEPLNAASPATRRSPASNTPTRGTTPPHFLNSTASPALPPPASIFDLEAPQAFDETNIGSPLKRQRASVTGLDDEAMKRRLGLGLSGITADSLAQIEPVHVKAEQDYIEDKLTNIASHDEPMAPKNHPAEDEEL